MQWWKKISGKISGYRKKCWPYDKLLITKSKILVGEIKQLKPTGNWNLPVSDSKFLKKQEDLVRNAARIKATVLRIEDTGKKINTAPVVLVSLRIESLTNRVSQVTSGVLLTGVKPTIGESIQIAFNPDDTSIIAIV